jgi:DNA-binding NarL/FixJ family response regulator
MVDRLWAACEERDVAYCLAQAYAKCPVRSPGRMSRLGGPSVRCMRHCDAGSWLRMPVAIALADDSLIVREGVARILADRPEVRIVASCGDLPSLLAAVDSERPDVVVTDIRMPPTGTDEGIRVAALLRETHPEIGVVVLSHYADPAYALALLESGSEGRAYLLKERVHDRGQLVAAIEAVAAGGSVLDSKIVEPLVAAKLQVERSPLAALTEREREVLAEIAKGKSNAAIADTLVLTKRAVEKHINSIFLKLNLSYSEDVSKRVKATLLYLAEAD